MNFKIDQKLFDDYPGMVIGVVVAKDIDNSNDSPEIHEILEQTQIDLRKSIGDQIPSQHPKIAPWREAYRKFGAKPGKYLSSIENLVKRVQKGNDLAYINSLVALYNIISMKYIVPVGGEDLDQMQGDLLLTVAGENEAPVRLLGEKEERSPYINEVIYKDGVGTICRRWNWKEADRTKLTNETQNAIFVIEALPPVTREIAANAASDLSINIERFCGGTTVFHMMDKEKGTISIG